MKAHAITVKTSKGKELGTVNVNIPSTVEEYEARDYDILALAETDLLRRMRNAAAQQLSGGKSVEEVEEHLNTTWKPGGSQLPEAVRQLRDELNKVNNAILQTSDPSRRKELLERKQKIEAVLFAAADVE